MNIGSWFGRHLLRPVLGQEPEARRLGDMRFCVLDIDVTGTSVRRDSVVGIAMLPVEDGRFRVSELSYCPLPGGAESPDGADPAWRDDYLALRERISGCPIVTYNPVFVRRMIERACRARDLPAPDGEWLDLIAVFGGIGSEDNELISTDYWLRKMKTGGRRPHDATYDVFAMAQMLLAVFAYCEDAGMDTLESLTHNQRVRAWFRRN